MVCKVCGRMIQNEEANFCEYCGTSFREGGLIDSNSSVLNANSSPMPEDTIQNTEEKTEGNIPWLERINQMKNGNFSGQTANSSGEQTVTFWQWLMVMLLPMIPVVGTIVYLILLFVWAFGASTPPTKKNWARATLIFLVVGFIFLGSALGITPGSLTGGV